MSSGAEGDPESSNEKPTDERFSSQTKRIIKGAINSLSTYAQRTRRATFADVERMSPAELNSLLVHFYRNVRKWNGAVYSKNAMMSLRFGLQKHFRKSGIDIVKDHRFIFANEAFLDVLAAIKLSGKATTKRALLPVTEEDLRKLYFSELLATDDPEGLQNKVFVDVMLHLCVRGRENLRDMKRGDFLVATDPAGRRCVAFADDPTGKRGEKSGRGLMYETPGLPSCPVASFEKYLARSNPELDDFWQKPNHHFKTDEFPAFWYYKTPVGKNPLVCKMKTLSADAGLATAYTNRCLLVTQMPAIELDVCAVRRVKSEVGGGSAGNPTQVSDCRDDSHPLTSGAFKTYTRRKAVRDHKPRSDDNTCNGFASRSTGGDRKRKRQVACKAVGSESQKSQKAANGTRRLRGRRRKQPFPASKFRREISTHRLWVRLSRLGRSRERGCSSQIELGTNADVCRLDAKAFPNLAFQVKSEPRYDTDGDTSYVLPCIKSEPVDPDLSEMTASPAAIHPTTEFNISDVLIKAEPTSDGEMDQISIGSVYDPSEEDSDAEESSKALTSADKKHQDAHASMHDFSTGISPYKIKVEPSVTIIDSNF